MCAMMILQELYTPLWRKYFLKLSNSPRRELLNGLNAILPPSDISNLSNELLVELILYGNERLPPGVNKRLIGATLEYTHATKRF